MEQQCGLKARAPHELEGAAGTQQARVRGSDACPRLLCFLGEWALSAGSFGIARAMNGVGEGIEGRRRDEPLHARAPHRANRSGGEGLGLIVFFDDEQEGARAAERDSEVVKAVGDRLVADRA